MTELRTILRAHRGRYLWGVTIGEGSLLSWQVGDPHLHVEMGRTSDGFDRRFAEPRGRWQVEILDGEIRVVTSVGVATLSAESEPSAEAEAVLRHLQGQALVSCELGDALTLRFDLEGELVVGGSHAWVRASGPEGEGEWSAS